MPLKAEPIAGGRMQREYDLNTGETIFVHAPIWRVVDFWGDLVEDEWVVANNGTGSGCGFPTVDNVGGALTFTLGTATPANDNDQDASFYWGGSTPQQFSVDLYTGVEFRFKVTSTDLTECAFGMGLSDKPLTVGTPIGQDVGAWAYLNGSFALKAGCDDNQGGGVRLDNISLGSTLTTATWYVLRMDFTNPADVKFYLDGAALTAATTIDVSGAAVNVSPSVWAQKDYSASTGSGGTMLLDYIKVWGMRE